jgi:hypothetical protein
MFFGTAQHYSNEYLSASGRQASYVSAGASAVGYSLAIAISDAFQRCTILDPNMDVNRLLFDRNVLACFDTEDKPINVTGYEQVLTSLAKQQLNTFFGEVQFNTYRRNVAMTPATTQVFACLCVIDVFLLACLRACMCLFVYGICVCMYIH